MKKAIVLIMVTAAITATSCYFAFRPRSVPQKPRLSVASPNRKFVAVIITSDFGSGALRLVVQSVHVVKEDGMGAASAGKIEESLETDGSSVAAIHSCENGDIDVRWTSESALVIRYSQTKPDWVSFVKIAEGISVSLEEIQKKPNQSPEPTSGLRPAAAHL